jgi:hypothetical protein
VRGGMGTARRLLWCAVLLAWPAVIGVKVAWNPPWGGGLSDGGAAFAVLLGALLLRRQAHVPRTLDWRVRRQVAELAKRMDAQEAAMARQQALRASGIEGIRRALDNAGVPVPDCVAADAPTQPVLRAVGRRAV